MIRLVLTLIAICIGTSAVMAQSKPLEERNALMKSMWREAWSPVTRMVREQDPYDQAKADAAFAKLAEIAAKLPPLWPENSKGTAPNAGFSSTSRVWENKKDFEARLASFTQAVAGYKSVAKGLDGLKTIHKTVNASCDSCHEPYRVRN